VLVVVKIGPWAVVVVPVAVVGVAVDFYLISFNYIYLKGEELTSLKKSSTLWTPVWKADVAWVTIPG
jgi:hypothetical protein